MQTLKTQKDFFCTITAPKFIPNDSIEIYQDLIFLRFEDVIKSSLPIFSSLIDEDILTNYIKGFISYGAKTAYVWKIPFEFGEFLINTNKITSKQYKDILKFELIQVKMYVSNDSFKYSKFNWNKRYRISSNAFILKTKANILNNNKKEQYILIYKDFEDFEIYYIEITKVVYCFFKYLRNNHNAKQSLKLACKSCGLVYKDVKDIINTTLNNFSKNGLII